MIVDLFYKFDLSLFNRSYHGLLETTFTVADELERKEIIRSRLLQRPIHPQPETHFIVDNDELLVKGILVLEIYGKSNAGLVTYLVTDPQLRGTGVARRLVEYVKSNFNCKFYFAEVHNPENVKIDVIDPFERMLIFNKLGFKPLPFKYIQPALSVEQHSVKTLSLMVLSTSAPQKKEIVLFLEGFYHALGVCNLKLDQDFQHMISSINDDSVNLCNYNTKANL